MTDGGGEYASTGFESFCASNGIQCDETTPYTLQHNGTSKRKNKTIVNTVRSMLKEKKNNSLSLGESSFHCCLFAKHESNKKIEAANT